MYQGHKGAEGHSPSALNFLKEHLMLPINRETVM